jgi:hypothetical protein
MTLKIVKVGTYRNGFLARANVDIIALDYDWWHSLAAADGQLEPGEEAMPLGADGFVYYGRIKEALKSQEPTWPDTFGHVTAAAAMQALALKLGKAIRWQ